MTRSHFHTDTEDRVYDVMNDGQILWQDGDPIVRLNDPCEREDCDPGTRRYVFDMAELAAFTIDITPRVLEALADETEQP